MAPGPMKIDKLQIHQQVEGSNSEAQIAELERERDEALASVAALRTGIINLRYYLVSKGSMLLLQDVLDVFNQHNLGAKFLERLRLAERVCLGTGSVREDLMEHYVTCPKCGVSMTCESVERDGRFMEAVADWRKFMRSEFGAPKKET